MAKINHFRCFSSPGKSTQLLGKFKGCLIGGLVGDCYGKPYKLSDQISKVQLQKYFDKLDGPYFKSPYKPYTANTALSNCVASSLASLQTFDATDVVKKFVKEFYENPQRDYGGNLSTIFTKLRGTKFVDPFGPGSEQYFGTGSYGNKAAASVHPIALFFHNSSEEMCRVSGKVAEIINSNKHGKNGAILQAWAVRLALNLNPDTPVDVHQYLVNLTEKVDEFETDEEGLNLRDVHKFKFQMGLVEKLLEKNAPTESEVVNTLGHAKVSFFSVPTAIYCFLRAVNEIPGFETDNAFRRTVQYATALGGDSDTIAAMAGAIAGACYGHSKISSTLQRHCEGLTLVENLAENLFQSVIKE